MILHLFEDNKFVDYAITQFNTVAANQNKFIILTPTDNYVCRNIIQKQYVDIIFYNSADYNNLCNNLSAFSAIIAHNLFEKDKENILLNAPSSVKLGWVFWGGDFYNRRENNLMYIGKRTKHLFHKKPFLQNIKTILLQLIKGESFFDKYQVSFETFRKLDFCITDIFEDYELAKKTFQANFQWAWYNYYSIEETIGSLKGNFVEGENILLGNSATSTNNHLEAFEIIQQLDIGFMKIITPLSYGEESYKNEIMKQGAILFGENFYPLIYFLEIEEYNKYILSCSIVIMNHYRHQAMGNIITALWLGSKVYLSKKTTTFNYLKRLGIHVYTIEEDLVPTNKLALRKLPLEKITQNREILIREYAIENVHNKVKELVTLLSA